MPKDEAYTPIGAWIVDEGWLQPGRIGNAIFTYVALAGLADHGGFVIPFEKLLARLTGQDIRTIRAHLRHLFKLKIIDTLPTPGDPQPPTIQVRVQSSPLADPGGLAPADIFLKLPHWIVRRGFLAKVRFAIVTWLVLARRADPKGTCYPTVASIARDVGRREWTIHQHTGELVRYCLLHIENRPWMSHHASNVYTVLKRPPTEAEFNERAGTSKSHRSVWLTERCAAARNAPQYESAIDHSIARNRPHMEAQTTTDKEESGEVKSVEEESDKKASAIAQRKDGDNCPLRIAQPGFNDFKRFTGVEGAESDRARGLWRENELEARADAVLADLDRAFWAGEVDRLKPVDWLLMWIARDAEAA